KSKSPIRACWRMHLETPANAQLSRTRRACGGEDVGGRDASSVGVVHCDAERAAATAGGFAEVHVIQNVLEAGDELDQTDLLQVESLLQARVEEHEAGALDDAAAGI